MTDLLLKNKKLLNEDIIEFNYNNEVFNNEVNDLITSFKNNYAISKISQDDKEILYLFIKGNENNTIFYKNIINNFITLLKYLIDLKKDDKKEKDDNTSENSKIYEILEKLKDSLSKEFLSIFEEKNELTVNKTSELFENYLKLIYKYVKDEIKEYQVELEEKELNVKKKKLEEYYEKESSLISKDNFETAIRLFMTLVLFREEDKVNKIKSNQKNIVDYLKAKDLWDKNIYNDKKFPENLNLLKNINIKINQIVFLIDIKEEDISDFQESSDTSSSKSSVLENESESEHEKEERE
jgi:hypothetical protein